MLSDTPQKKQKKKSGVISIDKSFFNYFTEEKPEILTTVICPEDEQKKQTDKNFSLFIDEVVIKNGNRISKLRICDTTFLHRHYDKKSAIYNDEKKETPWHSENATSIKRAEKAGIQVEYFSWASLLRENERKYEQLKKELLFLYEGDSKGDGVDEKFSGYVRESVTSNRDKGTRKERLDYIIEETAGTILLAGAKIVDPLRSWNKTICFAIEKYQCGIVHIPYKLPGFLLKPSLMDNTNISQSMPCTLWSQHNGSNSLPFFYYNSSTGSMIIPVEISVGSVSAEDVPGLINELQKFTQRKQKDDKGHFTKVDNEEKKAENNAKNKSSDKKFDTQSGSGKTSKKEMESIVQSSKPQ